MVSFDTPIKSNFLEHLSCLKKVCWGEICVCACRIPFKSGFWTSSFIRNSKHYKAQHFENWICSHPQVRGVSWLFSWVPYKGLTSITGQSSSCNGGYISIWHQDESKRCNRKMCSKKLWPSILRMELHYNGKWQFFAQIWTTTKSLTSRYRKWLKNNKTE
jgi:hypothetical protein